KGWFVTADAVDRPAGHLLDRDKEPEAPLCGDEADAVEERPRDAVPRRVEKDFAGDPDDPGVDALRVRQELPAHPRAAAIGGDQHVALGRSAVIEIGDNASVTLLVALECLAEMH